MKDYNKFLIDFMDSWKNLEGEKTCELFAENLDIMKIQLINH